MLYEVKYTGIDGRWDHSNEATVEADTIPEAIVAWNKHNNAIAGDNATEHYLVTPQADPIKVVLRKTETLPETGLTLTTADLPPQA